MKPSLQFRLSQHLTLTPQLQQSIRLLQLSTVELNQEIDRLLMENPALERPFVALLIDALDDDGYLTQSLEEIAAMLPAEAAADPESIAEDLSIALAHLQHFEPAGVGARSPGECLCLQLRNLPDDPVRTLALEIVEKHLELLAARDYSRLKALTGASDDALRAAQRLIRALNPRPGAAFAKIEARYVIPDVIVRKTRNVWRASL